MVYYAVLQCGMYLWGSHVSNTLQVIPGVSTRLVTSLPRDTALVPFLPFATQKLPYISSDWNWSGELKLWNDDPWRKDWSTVELLFKEPCFHCHRGQEEHAFNVRNVLLSGCSITQRSIHLHRRRWSESGKSSSVTQKWHTLLSCVVIAYLFCGILLVNNIKNMCMITWCMKYSHLEVSKNMKVHLRRVVPRVNYCCMMEILRFEWWVPSMSPMGKWGDVLWQVLYQDVGDESQLQWRLTHPLWEEPTLRPENWYQVQLWVLFWYLLKAL